MGDPPTSWRHLYEVSGIRGNNSTGLTDVLVHLVERDVLSWPVRQVFDILIRIDREEFERKNSARVVEQIPDRKVSNKKSAGMSWALAIFQVVDKGQWVRQERYQAARRDLPPPNWEFVGKTGGRSGRADDGIYRSTNT